MTDTSRERLRTTFTEDAGLYDRARPGYPRRMYEDLAGLATLGPGRRILELGCGTGQATVPLAATGSRVTAVELGAEMAEVARWNLAPYPRAEVVVSAFEEWPLPPEPFDLVLAATSFHWIDPAVRTAKAADALRPAGVLAVVSTHHVKGGSEEFFAEAQPLYERFDPATPPGLRLSPAADIAPDDTELAGSGRFGPVEVRRYEWDLTYSAQEYLDVLRTYSGHRALPAPARTGLLAGIADLIDDRHGGSITKRYLTELMTAGRIA
ncbi:methyltransferase type 11 [Kitasatospora indigofera]|uniref:Methyltransferase type 11 n=1 Tax=Kitasatospora indigofera TaxID=67307 RepID=A0A919KNA6_9ACTN|nr:class I SAM-dependent methyltransferase [Kitasatospora indigofera]GHH65389.1 methyltransferase type 11 [Kitasatospora indigofera]